MKTLLVSNSHDTLTSTKAALKKLGHEVVVAEDGVSAWVQLCDAAKPFQLVITDWLLPQPLDGLGLCKKIRSALFSSNTYIIMVTNRTATTDLQKGITLGVDDFITSKHLSNDELESKLRIAKRILSLEKTIVDKNAIIGALNVTLEQQSTKDQLTGLHNRRFFHQSLEEKLRFARRMEHSVSLLMVDIDKFATYKDEHGATSSDGILKLITNLLREQCRTSDFIARFGAEKFGIILPNTDDTGSMKCAEGLRKAANKLFWKSQPVTISIGAATIGHKNYTPEPISDVHSRIIRESGQALQHSKNAGHNRATHFDKLGSRLKQMV